jgi:hypothetical protein
MIRRTILLGLTLAVGAAPGCSKKRDEHGGLPPATEWNTSMTGERQPEPTGAPDEMDPHGMAAESDPHGGIAMDEDDPHANVDMSGEMGAGMGGASSGPLGLPPPNPDRPIDPTKYVRGTIQPSAAMQAKIEPGAIIYLSVKQLDPATGEGVGFALATEKYSATFPLAFEVNAKHQMVDGTPSLDGDVVVYAWTDQDGDAATKSPGDIIGSVKAKVPAADVKLTLDRELPR